VVSKQGLENWLASNQTYLPQSNDEDTGVPEETPISDTLCEHGALDPSKASNMKCINEVSPEPTAGYRKLDRKIRVLTTRSWLPEATLRRCFTLKISVQFASSKRIKVRVPSTMNRHPNTDSPFVQKNDTSKSIPA
jgi:hypothetical protein